MSFEDRWGSIWERSGLPNTTKKQIPYCLSDKTKRVIDISILNDEEIAALFREAVEKSIVDL